MTLSFACVFVLFVLYLVVVVFKCVSSFSSLLVLPKWMDMDRNVPIVSSFVVASRRCFLYDCFYI